MKKRTIMPAEWFPHQGTIVEWPVKASVVYPDLYEETCDAYREIILAINEFEKVYVIIDDTTAKAAMEACLDHVTYMKIDHNDAWVRDNGPTYVHDETGKSLGINWRFNAWGEKYLPYDLDDQVAGLFLAKMQHKQIDIPMVLEGGSIHVDGEGTLLSTKECLLNENRNPSMTQDEIESILSEALGVDKFLWLDYGLYGDETDGHIDNIACFVRPSEVMLQICDDPSDPNYDITHKAKTYLESSVDSKGRPIKVHTIEAPPARYFRDERLTLSYLNYYLVNGAVILPVFGGEAEVYDQRAIEKLEQLYPERQIVPVEGHKLIREGGNVHCITQQIPADREA